MSSLEAVMQEANQFNQNIDFIDYCISSLTHNNIIFQQKYYIDFIIERHSFGFGTNRVSFYLFVFIFIVLQGCSTGPGPHRSMADHEVKEPLTDASEAVIDEKSMEIHKPTPLSAGRAFESGDLETAELISEKLGNSAPELLIKARIAYQRAQYEKAIRLYHKMTDLVPEFEIKRTVELAEALAAAGREEEASSLLGGILAGKTGIGVEFRISLLEKQASWLKKSNKAKASVEILRKARSLSTSEVETDQLNMALAEALIVSGDKKKALPVLETMALNGATADLMKTAFEVLESSDATPAWTGEQRLARARRLFDLRGFGDALDTLTPLDDKKLKPEVDWLRARILYQMRRRYKEAVKALTPIARGPGPHADEARFLLARALSRRDRDEEAIKAYRAFAAKTKRAVKAAEARFLAARLEFYLGEHARALGALEQLVGNGRGKGKGKISDPGQRRDAHFLAGLSAVLLKKGKQAEPHLIAASEGSTNEEASERNRYWSAVAKTMTGKKRDREKGIALLRDICEGDSTGWYAKMAGYRLSSLEAHLGPCEGVPLETKSDGRDSAAASDAGAATSLSQEEVSVETVSPLVALYYRAGLFREAAEELRRMEQRRELALTSAQWVALYGAVEASHYALRHAARKLSWPPAPEKQEQARAAYPKPYEALFKEIEEKHRLPSLLLFAIARKESLFDPRAVSRAGAMGLMQMMPRTYEANRKRAGLEPLEKGELPGPEDSVKAAGFEFAHLFEKYNGSLVLSVMAYNAGTQAVDRWLERSGDLPADVFVEKAGFAETRNYVRRVVRTLTRYRLLDGEAPPKIPRVINRVAEAESAKKPDTARAKTSSSASGVRDGTNRM
jgi:soluble lytic murein transglycosylase-like protein/TolA-binding protein